MKKEKCRMDDRGYTPAGSDRLHSPDHDDEFANFSFDRNFLPEAYMHRWIELSKLSWKTQKAVEQSYALVE